MRLAKRRGLTTDVNADAEKIADDDKTVGERVEARNELESFAYSLKKQVSDREKLGGKLSSEERRTSRKQRTMRSKDGIEQRRRHRCAERQEAAAGRGCAANIVSKLYLGQGGGCRPVEGCKRRRMS